MVTAASMTPQNTPSSGARLFSRDGRSLPLKSSRLSVEAKGGIARTILTQRYVNETDDALSVTYLLPLPADGAVSGFCFTLAGERVVSKIEKKAVARERYEAAIASGHSAALLEQDRTSVFTQKVGNIPPQSEVECEVVVDQRLIWIGDQTGAWEWRFPTVVGPRYMGEPGRVDDAAKITVDVADGALPTTLELDVQIGDTVIHDRMAESPSHPIMVQRDGSGRRVSLDVRRGARLDRDVIVRWAVSQPEVGVQLASGRSARDELAAHTYGLLTLVPPEAPESMRSVSRDLILLIDTSGSMGGRPLDQARQVLSAMIESLAPHDRLEMIEFSSRPNRWKREPVVATRDGKRAALSWLAGLRAGGGTEMKSGLLEAITPLRDGAQRQVVLVTDGYIGFEDEIVRTVLDRLPKSCRLHTVGVGSSPNRSLLTPAARAGGGVEITLALDEDVERGAKRIVEKTAAPLVTELTISGDVLERAMPHTLPDLYAGCPALLPVELSPLGGRITVRGRTGDGTIEQHVTVPPLALGEGHQAVAALFAREWVEDLETLRAAGGDKRDADMQIERVGLDFEIATRLTSFVAVSESRTIDPNVVARDEVMPQEIPYGASVEGFGLRSVGSGPAQQELTRAGSVRRSRAKRPAQTPASFGGAKDDFDSEDVTDMNATPDGRMSSSPRLRALEEAEFSEEDVAAELGDADVLDGGRADEATQPGIKKRESSPPSPPASSAPKDLSADLSAVGAEKMADREVTDRDAVDRAASGGAMDKAAEAAPPPAKSSAVMKRKQTPTLVWLLLFGGGIALVALILWLLFGTSAP